MKIFSNISFYFVLFFLLSLLIPSLGMVCCHLVFGCECSEKNEPEVNNGNILVEDLD